MFWGSILSLGSPFLAFLHLQFWRLGGLRLLGRTLSSTFWRSISLLLVSYIPILSFWSFGFSVLFSPLASFVPRAQPNQAAFWAGITLLRPFIFRVPFRRVYQLNPTDFLLSKHSSIHFLNLENFHLGFGGNLLLLNSFCVFTIF